MTSKLNGTDLKGPRAHNEAEQVTYAGPPLGSTFANFLGLTSMTFCLDVDPKIEWHVVDFHGKFAYMGSS